MRYLTLALFSLFTLFCIIVAVGLGAGFGVVLLKSIKQARLTRQQNKKIRDLEQQVKNLTPAEKPETLPEA